MIIFLDGHSGVGKTYWARQWTQQFGGQFLDFLPDVTKIHDEVELHQWMIDRWLPYVNSPIVYWVEGSPVQSWIVHQGMLQQKLITADEYDRIFKATWKVLQSHFNYRSLYIVHFRDQPDHILAHRTQRGRPFEYAPNVNLEQMDRILDQYEASARRMIRSSGCADQLHLITFDCVNLEPIHMMWKDIQNKEQTIYGKQGTHPTDHIS